MTDTIKMEVRGLEEIAALFEAAPEIVLDEMTAATVEASLLLEREIKELTPVGATGALRQSIAARLPRMQGSALVGSVGSSLAHALPVELGTRPHFPPIEPIIDWLHSAPQGQALMQRVHADDSEALYYEVALGIARKIAARGTLGVGMFHRAFAIHQDQVQEIFRRANERVVERMGSA